MENFGKKMLEDFYLDTSYVHINHGSFGTCPKEIMQAKHEIQIQMESVTDKFIRMQTEQKVKKVRQFVASRVGCSAKNLFIVENATDGFNSLMKSLKWQEGDVVLLPSICYSSIRSTTELMRDLYKIQIINVNITRQDLKSPEAFLLKVQQKVNQFGRKIKLAVFDHIASKPGIVCPIQELREFLHKKDIAIFIDAAHAMCQLDINLQKFQVDGYFSNFHKWAFAPKGSAFLYISDKFLPIIRPVITGNLKGVDRQFYCTGTRDFSSYYVIPLGIEYYQRLGKEAVKKYNKKLVWQAGLEMAKIWNTDLLTEDKRFVCFMNNVRVPSKDLGLCLQIQRQMLEEHKCYMVIFEFDGSVYCRISAQIYNELSDYKFAANIFLELLREKEKQKQG